MTPGDEDDLERGGDDMLAAEYVLGVLPADERQRVAARIDAEPEFGRLAEAWQAKLSPARRLMIVLLAHGLQSIMAKNFLRICILQRN